MVHLFKGIQRLVPSELESKLYDFNKKYALISEKGWSIEAHKNGLFIDPKVGWASYERAILMTTNC